MLLFLVLAGKLEASLHLPVGASNTISSSRSVVAAAMGGGGLSAAGEAVEPGVAELELDGVAEALRPGEAEVRAEAGRGAHAAGVEHVAGRALHPARLLISSKSSPAKIDTIETTPAKCKVYSSPFVTACRFFENCPEKKFSHEGQAGTWV